jgi:hypothetical protein
MEVYNYGFGIHEWMFLSFHEWLLVGKDVLAQIMPNEGQLEVSISPWF